MFDIKKHNFSTAAEFGYEFELKLPTGADSGAKLVVIGDLSPTVKAYNRRNFQEYQQKAATAKRKGKELDIDLDDAEDMAIQNALVRLIGWKGITDNGKEVDFSKDKALEILTDHPWIREAIMIESADVTNFTPKIESK